MATSAEVVLMRPLPIDTTADAALSYKGEKFPIRWHDMVQNCSLMRRQPFPSSPIEITSAVQRESIIQFLKACENKEFSLSRSIAHDVLM